MGDHLNPEESMLKRLRWLMFFRVIIITFLLGVAAFIQIIGTGSLPSSSLYSIYYIIIITYFLSFIYAVLLKTVANFRLNVYIQTLSDVVLVTVLVHVTGGIESIYSVFYPLIVIYSVLFLDRRGGFVTAVACSVMYSADLCMEYYGVMRPVYGISISYDYGADYIFTRIFIHVASFFIAAVLASFVVDREKKLKVLLEEKESAFNQLDVLHRSIIESVDTGILTFDLKGELKSFNRAAEEISGYRFHDVKNRRVEEIFPGISPLIHEEKQDAQKKEARNRFELDIMKGPANRKTLGFASSALMDGEGKMIGHILIFQDLTTLKEMEKEVERNKRLALIGEMTACFAHEMRNPLASISGSVQMLRRDLNLSETEDRLMNIILRGKDQLEALLKDFLLIARTSVEHREKIDVHELVGDVLESLRCSAEWNDAVEVAGEFRNPSFAYGNKTEIRQAIWNLMLNAVQAMPEGGKLDVKTSALSENGKEYLAVEVSDRGCGIAEKDIVKIFEPFYTTKERGTGLGLAVVSRITESNGGVIRAEARPDGGSRFVMMIPQYGG